jgi:hypothetical protein
MKRATLALLKELHDAQKAVDVAEGELVSWEADEAVWPGREPLDTAMERRQAAIDAIVQVVASWSQEG